MRRRMRMINVRMGRRRRRRMRIMRRMRMMRMRIMRMLRMMRTMRIMMMMMMMMRIEVEDDHGHDHDPNHQKFWGWGKLRHQGMVYALRWIGNLRTAGDMPAMSTPMCADGYVGDGCVSCNQARGWLKVGVCVWCDITSKCLASKHVWITYPPRIKHDMKFSINVHLSGDKLKLWTLPCHVWLPESRWFLKPSGLQALRGWIFLACWRRSGC